MDSKYITPFIDSVLNTMKTMLGETPRRKESRLKQSQFAQGDISGIVGFASNDIYGSVALSFPTATAIKSYNLMVGDSADKISDDVRDTVGELTNIVAGGAKKIYAEKGNSFDISIPTIVVGKNHMISHKAGTPVVIVPFSLGADPFVMEVSVKVDKELWATGKIPVAQTARK